ncbi:DUF4870 domain-containing protein [Rhodoluna sp.]|uniref:DUF4870 domain-containing protein n=1 Tax=Rhodoluna sp. TaxID=1969481 RepID=UPI0025F9F337|nr:DUF4870 domain-containing protein [Rhodoluna sp.]
MSDNDYTTPAEPLSKEGERFWAIAVHALGIVLEFFAPLLGYLLLKDRGPFIRHHVIESLNFGLNMLLLYVVLAISVVGWLFFWVPPIIWVIFRIIAAYKASLGEFYRYPWTIKFIKH